MGALPENLRELRSEDFHYHLPDEAIARFPLEKRDASKLLTWHRGNISHGIFSSLPDKLPANAMLVLNDTRVLPARLHFQRSSGAWIEILVLGHKPGKEAGSMDCEAIIGNKKKWREDEILLLKKDTGEEKLELRASWKNREKDEIILKWQPEGRQFPEVLAMWGEMPIPPYLNRKSEKSDLVNYQTVYARQPGAVAAPTAGLHFTPEVFEKLHNKGIACRHITLHVGLGTFRPMKAEKVADHEMHPEEVIFHREIIAGLAGHEGPVIAVGTTSVRSLESLFWLALQRKETGIFPGLLETEVPYRMASANTPYRILLQDLYEWMLKEGLEEISFQTRLYLMPGYRFRVITGMVTNFHQPGSTLMVLVAAFTGDDWKKIYSEALASGYRFLSYGDSSLLLGSEPEK